MRAGGLALRAGARQASRPRWCCSHTRCSSRIRRCRTHTAPQPREDSAGRTRRQAPPEARTHSRKIRRCPRRVRTLRSRRRVRLPGRDFPNEVERRNPAPQVADRCISRWPPSTEARGRLRTHIACRRSRNRARASHKARPPWVRAQDTGQQAPGSTGGRLPAPIGSKGQYPDRKRRNRTSRASCTGREDSNRIRTRARSINTDRRRRAASRDRSIRWAGRPICLLETHRPDRPAHTLVDCLRVFGMRRNRSRGQNHSKPSRDVAAAAGKTLLCSRPRTPGSPPTGTSTWSAIQALAHFARIHIERPSSRSACSAARMDLQWWAALKLGTIPHSARRPDRKCRGPRAAIVNPCTYRLRRRKGPYCFRIRTRRHPPVEYPRTSKSPQRAEARADSADPIEGDADPRTFR